MFGDMSNWHSIYHQALLVRLVSMALIFGVLWPVLWFLFIAAWRLVRPFVRRFGQNTRLRQGHLS